MFKRGISIKQVKETIKVGEIVIEYPEDKPFPSKMALTFFGNIPLHVVYAEDSENNEYIVITSYIPSEDLWEKDFKTRRK